MATVYLADDLRHERKVAVKALRPELAAVVGAERFLAEIKTTANLQHPNILPLFDSGAGRRSATDWSASSSSRWTKRSASPAMWRRLHAAHERGVMHWDVKPANILLSKGRPLVADFGIALAVSG